MTFYEKLREMHPKADAAEMDEYVAFCCPADLGLEQNIPESCPNFRGAASNIEACFRCWDRKMEGGA